MYRSNDVYDCKGNYLKRDKSDLAEFFKPLLSVVNKPEDIDGFVSDGCGVLSVPCIRVDLTEGLWGCLMR